MNFDLDKPAWQRFRLGDVIRRSRKQVDPIAAGVDRYVAGGHIDGESITVDRWGDPNDGQMGSTFRYVFEPGQILFVSARPYLRKCGVVDFSGVVADKTYVLDAIPEKGLLQRFLPLVLASDHFIAYATAEATGSMNPRLLWGPMQRYEVNLPPLDQQERIADLFWAIESHRRAVLGELASAKSVRLRWREVAFEQCAAMELADLCNIRGSLVDAAHDDFAELPHVGIDRIDPDSGRLFGVRSAREDNVISGKNLFESGDLIYSKIRPNQGKLAVAPYRGLCSADAYPLVPASGVPVELLREAMLAPEFYERVVAASTRTAMPKINRTELFAIPIRFPDAESRDSIRSQISQLDSQQVAIETEREAIETVFRAALATFVGGQ